MSLKLCITEIGNLEKHVFCTSGSQESSLLLKVARCFEASGTLLTPNGTASVSLGRFTYLEGPPSRQDYSHNNSEEEEVLVVVVVVVVVVVRRVLVVGVVAPSPPPLLLLMLLLLRLGSRSPGRRMSRS